MVGLALCSKAPSEGAVIKGRGRSGVSHTVRDLRVVKDVVICGIRIRDLSLGREAEQRVSHLHRRCRDVVLLIDRRNSRSKRRADGRTRRECRDMDHGAGRRTALVMLLTLITAIYCEMRHQRTQLSIWRRSEERIVTIIARIPSNPPCSDHSLAQASQR